MSVKGFILYRIYYGEHLVYIGRTKQPLQDRIRGHMFSKPMHRTIAIEQVSRIEYAEFKTEADMNLYEIYLIVKLHPPLNVDDKTRDYPTIELPEVEWKVFTTPLWEGWKDEILHRESEHKKMLREYQDFPQKVSVLRFARRSGDITENEFYDKYDSLKAEHTLIEKKLWGR